MATNEAGYQPRNLHLLTRWAAFTGIFLLVVRRFVYAAFPNALPSSAWPPTLWWTGTLATMAFELFVLLLLLGVPFCIYHFGLRNGHTTARDLWIDCAATGGLYLAAFLLL